MNKIWSSLKKNNNHKMKMFKKISLGLVKYMEEKELFNKKRKAKIIRSHKNCLKLTIVNKIKRKY